MTLLPDIRTHNGTITVQSPSGQHRTFRIKTQPKDSKFKPGERIIALMTGSDNEQDFTQLGTVNIDGSIHLWRRHNTSGKRSLVRVVQNPEHYQGLGCEYLFEGRCRVCNRKLTTPDSIRSGIGPICSGRE